ncbi:MAG: ribonuclease PH [Nitrospirota bacterium]|nr:ribonuclease PH [Nitrospirota bacterium]MDH5767415.1 ribonuclease PH [Nitrospirota bacterium]
MRPDGRKNNEIRGVKVQRNFITTAEGSVLIEIGHTRVICTATIEDKIPPFLKDQKKGWITAEYSMIPRATQTRLTRESSAGRMSGRTHEIQRLIGRALRSVVDLSLLGERTIWIDCDVIQADGGTRTAAITGAFISLSDALRYALRSGLIEKMPIKDYLAAISVGVVDGDLRMDLCYSEDSIAEVDMNIVMTGSRKLVEIQGTAEGLPFSKTTLNSLIELAEEGISSLIKLQKKLIEGEVMSY